MKLDLELDDRIGGLITAFQNSPEKVDRATRRALKKLSRFAERHTLRALARQQGITQKTLKALGRVKVSLLKPGERGSEGYSLVVWIGASDLPAHYLGQPRQTTSGVKTGKHFWKGAFLMQPVNAPRPMVFRRKDNWQHQYQRSKKSGRMMWMGLPLEKQALPMLHNAIKVLEKLKPLLLERFTTLMQQELNFLWNEAFNI
ncbi:hypothetical protein [Endozoicomonas numazuensis]|uniref:Phage tail protein n=1 Tax=Endozoicomonas numazuensis TaxID=1137799 RepID=A0A081NFB1_9GAMM|nr:hypothetical protein [Endozoicomonas numazuensis]KEQ17134.1 hypothetical protein GZ78_14790 [Endozoicomonas numazuensis]